VKLATKPLVAVTWDDAHGTNLGDYSESEIERDFHKAARYTTFGLLVKEDTAGVTLASDVSEGSYRGVAFIPRGMIVDLVNLGIPQKRKTNGSRRRRGSSESVPARASEVPADHAQGN
jgi:hypothetical protein